MTDHLAELERIDRERLDALEQAGVPVCRDPDHNSEAGCGNPECWKFQPVASEWQARGNAAANEASVREYLEHLPTIVRSSKYTVHDLVGLATWYLRDLPEYVRKGERAGHPTLGVVRVVLAEIERRLQAAEERSNR